MCGILGYTGNYATLSGLDEAFKKLRHRGPDDTEKVILPNSGVFYFHRLSIMDLSHNGDQPFVDKTNKLFVMCNGEIYNYRDHYENYKSRYQFKSKSDCEVILPLYLEFGIEKTAQALDAEFAFVIYDGNKDLFFAARDPIGIRPLFYGFSKSENKIMFASEVKAIHDLCSTIQAFPPGHYYDGQGKFIPYCHISKTEKYNSDSMDTILKNIRELLIEGVRKRLASDAPIGYLLSGGVDSSLVCGIAAKILNQKLTTFSVGMDKNPIDIKYAKIVADFIQSTHHEVYFTKADIFKHLKDVIYYLETWDITTIRASMGMYLVCKYIREKTPIKVVLTGEISDEIFGYKYTDFAPNATEFQNEAIKRVDEIYMYDVLRADRSISAHSLEARVPFGDLEFVKYVMSIPPELKMNKYNMGKYLLRAAFKDLNILPDEIFISGKSCLFRCGWTLHGRLFKRACGKSLRR
ncbi:MAG: asparagine synthase B [Bacteriovoracaceae bacterium]